MAATKNASDFRKTLRRALFLTEREERLFDRIPDVVLDGVFRHNFNGNLAMAERVLFNRYREVERVDRTRLEQEKQNIANLGRAAGMIAKALDDGENVLFVTDNDNDGSLAQAVLIEFLKTLPAPVQRRIHIEYAQPIGAARGLTVDIVAMAARARGWSERDTFTIVTADNGINNRGEQDKIQALYPSSSLVVTDHHLPDPAKVIREDEGTVIFNPKHLPTEYFKRKNISGANTLGVLLTATLKEFLARQEPGPVKFSPPQVQAVANMNEIGGWANLLDYANADLADMPARPYVMDKALRLRPLLNVSTSMSNLVTGAFTPAEVNRVLAAAPGLRADWLHDKLADICALNVFARKLLALYHRHRGASHALSSGEFYSMLSNEVNDSNHSYHSINPNYIEQLRPIIFNLSAIDNKDLFMTLTSDTMVGVFEELRQMERDLLAGLREVGLLRQDKRAHSTVLYPVDAAVTKLFNRRLLGKAYNEDNNGFLLILSSFGGQEASGSMRSLYPITDILQGKEAIERRLGITLEFQGHEQAAGFFVRSADGSNVTEDKLSRLNAWLDDRLTTLKTADRINQMPNLELDFASIGLATKINATIKANLAGMWGLPTVLRLSPNKNDEVWITDPDTTEQVSLSQIVKRKKYGYQAIATDFGGGAIVVPVELLRAVVDSGYKKGLRLSYMNEGVFMANQVVDVDALPNLVRFQGGRRDQEHLAEYYAKTYRDSHFIPLSREDFRSSPYFRFNKYGEVEFQQWESLVIQFLDRTGRDVLAVVDTEGTGLGKAPKCFNIGGTNLAIDPSSGQTMDRESFEAHYFRTEAGKEFLLTSDQVARLVRQGSADSEAVPGVGLVKMSLREGIGYFDRYVYPGSPSDLEQLTNVSENPDSGQVVYNRRLHGFAFSFLVKNNDFAITKEFEDLTGISNWMVNALGKPAKQVDQLLSHHYDTLKGPTGEPAKIIFQAHNMPYDKGVVAANFQRFNQLMDDHVTSDTAKIARQEKLAYDDTPVTSFLNVEGIPAKTYFYDSPYSDYSLGTFLDRCARGKGGVFPDTTAKLLLRYNPYTEGFSVIDREANREIELASTLGDLQERRQSGPLPNNAVKYSVERLSSRAMIRNIMLLDKPASIKVDLREHEIAHRAALEMFQENYHFDSSPDTNIEHFRASLLMNQQASLLLAQVDLSDLAERFLDANRATQAKFHDCWIYEKVLAHYEPSSASKRVTADIVEQVNYYTDLPDKKIRKVFEDVINFKRHFGIEHALVHEQHNNIRQHSADGQGLSDTSYEAVLPQMLTWMKFYNPYYRSNDEAVRQLIDSNVKGSLIQNMIAGDFNNELARDSYSMTQMLGFRRQAKTDVVRRAQTLAKEGSDAGQALAPIKLKLAVDILPPGSAIYGQPKRHLSQQEIDEVSEKLKFIVVNEQVKSAVHYSDTVVGEHGARLVDIVTANDQECIALRDEIMGLFHSVTYSRRDAKVKKVSDMMKDVFDGVEARIPRGFEVDDEMLAVAEGMAEGYQRIVYKLGHEPEEDEVNFLLDRLRGQHEKGVERRNAAIAAMESQRSCPPPSDRSDTLEEEREPVRNATFLPSLDIQRREPMKFVLQHFGVKLFFPMLRQRALEADTAQHAQRVEAVPPRSRRFP